MLGMRTPLSGTLTAAPPCSRAQQAAARSVRTDEAVLVSMLVFGPPQQAGQHAVRQCAGRSARSARMAAAHSCALFVPSRVYV